jgi:hypothetical protein
VLIDSDFLGDHSPAGDDIADLGEDRLGATALEAGQAGDRSQVGDGEPVALAASAGSTAGPARSCRHPARCS